MDMYSMTADLCRRLAGRVPDDYINVTRSHFSAGEFASGLQATILGLQDQHIAITDDEADLIGRLLIDAELDSDEMDAIPRTSVAPPVEYEFNPGEADGLPDPSPADRIIRELAVQRNYRWIGRTWRTPLTEYSNAAIWLYLVKTAPGIEEFGEFSLIDSRFSCDLGVKWLMEVFDETANLPMYHRAALSSAKQIWPD
ncbi:hypothetical protein ACL02S_05390 [Nocardia sp. 004]|uniref:hypothetical protein n=1 Tax=Nocardia sp. 004 TaxID=3385978 RepID=UPI0039A01D7E